MILRIFYPQRQQIGAQAVDLRHHGRAEAPHHGHPVSRGHGGPGRLRGARRRRAFALVEVARPVDDFLLEGVATAQAVVALAGQIGVEMPVTAMVDALASGRTSVKDAVGLLMGRPLKQE